MSYKDEYHPQFKKDLKKLDKKVIIDIFNSHIDSILVSPFAGKPLQGELNEVLSYHFKKSGVEYRLAYFVDKKRQIVYFVMAGARENFYDVLKRRIFI